MDVSVNLYSLDIVSGGSSYFFNSDELFHLYSQLMGLSVMTVMLVNLTRDLN
jgi:hypothetical protein